MKKQLLVLDDEEEIVQILCDILSSECEFQVDGFSQAHEAIEALKTKNYAVIISDIQMPKMTGLEFLREIRTEHHILTPVVFLTGFADVQPEEIIEAGAYCVLNKPWDLGELISVLNKASNSPALGG